MGCIELQVPPRPGLRLQQRPALRRCLSLPDGYSVSPPPLLALALELTEQPMLSEEQLVDSNIRGITPLGQGQEGAARLCQLI